MSDPIKKPDPEIKGVKQLQVKRLKNIFGAKWRLANCYKERSMDPKISCMILCFYVSVEIKSFIVLIFCLNMGLGGNQLKR